MATNDTTSLDLAAIESGTKVLIDGEPYILSPDEGDPIPGIQICIAYTPAEWDAEAKAYELLVQRESDGACFLHHEDGINALADAITWHASRSVSVEIIGDWS